MRTAGRPFGVTLTIMTVLLAVALFGAREVAFGEEIEAAASLAQEAIEASNQQVELSSQESADSLVQEGEVAATADQEGAASSAEPQDQQVEVEDFLEELPRESSEASSSEAEPLYAASDGDDPVGAPTRVSAIYVNGSSGNDANPGTEASPVKTFQRAKELMQAQGASTIYVLGALQVKGTSEAWDLDGKTLARGNGYHGELVQLSNNVTLSLTDIVIDGRSGDGQTGVAGRSSGRGGSLIGVDNGTLTVGEGAVLQNNKISSHGAYPPDAGGAIYARAGVVNVQGGTIRNNEAVYGGGIYGRGALTINMSSGTITGNRAVEGNRTDFETRAYGGSGAGICINDGAQLNFSGGAITANVAAERGGGISVGTHWAPEGGSPVLTMTGGTISNNTAGASGGGIFVQAGHSASSSGGVATYGIARISGGSITGNTMTDRGYGNSMFGGGGIYVNGYSSAYPSLHNGELYLVNAEISGNYASIAGGGYAACPVSTTEVDLADGAALYGNTTQAGNARELYVLASRYLGAHSGDPVYEVSPSMLGGGAYKWVYDNGTEVPLDKLKGVLRANQSQSLSLSNSLGANDAAIQKALSLVKVHITGNKSYTRGGGIGSNGSVFIGTEVETTEVTVSKLWLDDNNESQTRPVQVEVELYRDGEYVGYQVVRPDKDGKWSTVFKNLPCDDAHGHQYVYTVAERDVAGYASAVTGNAGDGFTITNAIPTSVSGVKVWDDADDQDGKRPSSVTVRLMRGDEEVASTAVTAENGWTFRFDDVPKYDVDGNECAYTLAEDAVDGYRFEVSGDVDSGFTVTNVHQPGTVDVAVSKVWDDEDDKDEIRPTSVTVRLYANDADTGLSLVLNSDNEWSGSFKGLDEYKDGSKISYRVAEDEVAGYTTKVAGDAQDGYVVTNSHVPEKEDTPSQDIPEKPDKPDKPDKPTNDTPDKPEKSSPKTPKRPSIPQLDDKTLGTTFSALLSVAGCAALLIAWTMHRRREV